MIFFISTVNQSPIRSESHSVKYPAPGNEPDSQKANGDNEFLQS